MIFCVEDDQAIRDLMIYAMNSAGFEAIAEYNASVYWICK